jgi:hypothetical protein
VKGSDGRFRITLFPASKGANLLPWRGDLTAEKAFPADPVRDIESNRPPPGVLRGSFPQEKTGPAESFPVFSL